LDRLVRAAGRRRTSTAAPSQTASTPTAPGVAVAYSGGGDSHALLLIALAWARGQGGDPNPSVTALIVDHQLRATSGADAERARQAAVAAGASADILTWTDPDRATGGHGRARAARHRLLAEACAMRGLDVLLLAHTADDVAETLVMRLARPARARGLAGLAQIAPSPVWPDGAGLALVRPLLDVRRAELRDRLHAAGLSWIDDPANVDPRHERVRARAALAAWEGAGVCAARWTALAAAAAKADAVERAAAARLIASGVRLFDGGWAQIDRVRFAGAARPVRVRALEAVIGAVAGTPGPAPRASLERALDALSGSGPGSGPGSGFRGITLSGAALSPMSEGQVLVARDPGAVLGRVDDVAHVEGARPLAQVSGRWPVMRAGVWDGRFRIGAALTTGGQVVPAEAVLDRLNAADRARLLTYPALARRTAPVLLDTDGMMTLARGVFMGSQAIARRLFPQSPQTWSDDLGARDALGMSSLALPTGVTT